MFCPCGSVPCPPMQAERLALAPMPAVSDGKVGSLRVRYVVALLERCYVQSVSCRGDSRDAVSRENATTGSAIGRRPGKHATRPMQEPGGQMRSPDQQ